MKVHRLACTVNGWEAVADTVPAYPMTFAHPPITRAPDAADHESARAPPIAASPATSQAT